MGSPLLFIGFLVVSALFMSEVVLFHELDPQIQRGALSASYWQRRKDSDILDKQENPDQGIGLHAHLPLENHHSYVEGGLIHPKIVALGGHNIAKRRLADEPVDIWKEPEEASAWKPCVEHRKHRFSARQRASTVQGPNDQPTKQKAETKASSRQRYITVAVRGSVSQQRVGICNAVAVAYYLNATLVQPSLLHHLSSKGNHHGDETQTDDIFDMPFLSQYMADDVPIISELPRHFQSLDLIKMGVNVTEAILPKEAPLQLFLRLLPILQRTGVLHFHGFFNALASDPIPVHVQRLRCRCMFYALRFLPRYYEAAAVAVGRLRATSAGVPWDSLSSVPHHDRQPNFREPDRQGQKPFLQDLWPAHQPETLRTGNSPPKDQKGKFVALHLRFDIEVASYSMCMFGGGLEEWQELQEYRKHHFAALFEYESAGRLKSSDWYRKEGRCPVTPEEAGLVLAAIGLDKSRAVFLVGAQQIFGRARRLAALQALFPRIFTLDTVLSPAELAPFAESPQQMAALDFLISAVSDLFLTSDSSSQFAGLVAGHRMFLGGGQAPAIRPVKVQLAYVLHAHEMGEWEDLAHDISSMISSTKWPKPRQVSRSIYRHPRGDQCMCFQVEGSKTDEDEREDSDEGEEQTSSLETGRVGRSNEADTDASEDSRGELEEMPGADLGEVGSRNSMEDWVRRDMEQVQLEERKQWSTGSAFLKVPAELLSPRERDVQRFEARTDDHGK